MRPGVGFSPQIPQKCAGTRIEPPPSLPTPPAEQPAAIAAASPPLEPPEECAKSHGLLVFAEEDGACSLQSRNEWSVPFCNVVFAEKRTGGTGPAGDVDAALDAERHALEKADLHALCYQALRCARLPTSAFGVQMDKHIQFRLQLFNTFEVKFNEFDGRDFLGVNFLRNFR
jgi:hypothetical protein